MIRNKDHTLGSIPELPNYRSKLGIIGGNMSLEEPLMMDEYDDIMEELEGHDLDTEFGVEYDYDDLIEEYNYLGVFEDELY